MTNVSSPPPMLNKEEIQYLPLKDFFEKMSLSDTVNPYSSTFSFIPFIEKMQADKGDMRSNFKALGLDTSLMDQVKQNLMAFSGPQHLNTPEKRQEVIRFLFPSLFFEGQMGFVAKPFTKEFFYMTPVLEEVFTSEDWEVKITGSLAQGKMSSPGREAGKLILQKLYKHQVDSSSYQTMTFRHKDNQLERHLKINIVLDYINTTPLKKIKALDKKQIHELLDNWDNEDFWLKHFPPEDFVFEGLVVGYIQDVTEVEVLSTMKEMMISGTEEELEDSTAIRQILNNLICSYLQIPGIAFGFLLKRDFRYAKLFSWSIVGDVATLSKFSNDDFYHSDSYGKAIKTQEPAIINDLREIKAPNEVERLLLEKGFRSLLLHPQRDANGQMIGILELASKEPYTFNRLILDKLRDIISLYAVGTNRWIQELDNNINFFIQKQFTYIHPSVEWKFQEVSQKFLLSPRTENTIPSLDSVAFKDVYPLYGQADIVGSSKIRNRSIEADMLDNLQRVQKLIKAFRKKLSFQLLDVYLEKTLNFSKRLEKGGYVSSDESQIVELLTEEIHPLLRELHEKYDYLPNEIFNTYFDYLDPKLDIVYRKRRDYEDSVYQLNNLISHHIDKEVAKKQEVLPHFFEKYVTDGVEYNIYIGQAILQEGKFSYYFLKDFRLWQLLLMCDVTRLVEKNKDKFLVPLSTAQLIFVYNNALSIRFDMDEKQFDVDGAYNVRYEILKKRIDKAVIKGTKERLTQKGKIAIVWLQEKDRFEYLEYIHHLLEKGYISDEIEELELERLQGADGLKAIRVTVKV